MSSDSDTDIENLASGRDPYPGHRALLSAGAHRMDDGRWLVATADDVESVLGSSVASIGFAADDPAAEIQSRMARFSDGADQRRRRAAAIIELFAIDPVQLRAGAAARTAQLLAAGATGEIGDEVDLMSVVARRVPVAVLAGALRTTSDRDADDAAAGGAFEDAVVEATIELALAIAPPRGRARGDAASPVRRILQLLGRSGEPDDRSINVVALLFQAVDATAGLIGNGVLAAARTGFVGSGSAVDDFVREVSRFDPAVHFTVRRTTADLVAGRATVPADSIVVVDLAAAGRDPARFDDPDELMPDRGGPSFAFGDGVHRCPGSDHALALASGIVDAVLAGGLEVTSTDVAYEDRFNLRVPSRLVLRR